METIWISCKPLECSENFWNFSKIFRIRWKSLKFLKTTFIWHFSGSYCKFLKSLGNPWNSSKSNRISWNSESFFQIFCCTYFVNYMYIWFEILWKSLEFPENLWNFLKFSKIFEKSLEFLRNHCKLLESLGNLWNSCEVHKIHQILMKLILCKSPRVFENCWIYIYCFINFEFIKWIWIWIYIYLCGNYFVNFIYTYFVFFCKSFEFFENSWNLKKSIKNPWNSLEIHEIHQKLLPYCENHWNSFKITEIQ